MMSHPQLFPFDDKNELPPHPPHPPQKNKRIRMSQMLLLLLFPSQAQLVPQLVAVKSLMFKASIYEFVIYSLLI